MSIEIFDQIVKCSKFYYFKSLKDFDDRIDWNGTRVKNISFVRGIKDDREYSPCLWSAYGTDEKKLSKIKR